jgi:hypothetical protein
VGERPVGVARNARTLLPVRALVGALAQFLGEAALDLLDRLLRLGDSRYLPSYHLALAHVGLGDIDNAFEALAHATVEADPALLNLRVEPRFELLRSDARYTRIIELLGL